MHAIYVRPYLYLVCLEGGANEGSSVITAAAVMALSAVRTMHRPDVIAAAKAEVIARNGGKYSCPLPDSVQPPLDTY